MKNFLRILFPRTAQNAEKESAKDEDLAAHERKESERAEREEREKKVLEQRIHDTAARLHVLEWQADVEGRRRKPK